MNDLTLTRRGIMGALIAAGAASAVDIGLPGAVLAQRAISGDGDDAALQAAYSQYHTLNEGKNADYIPALAQVKSEFFGIAVAGRGGKVDADVHSRKHFSVLPMSRVFPAARGW